MLMCRADEGLDILGEAGAPIATPCIEELAADESVTTELADAISITAR